MPFVTPYHGGVCWHLLYPIAGLVLRMWSFRLALVRGDGGGELQLLGGISHCWNSYVGQTMFM